MEESWIGIVDTVVWIYWDNIIKAAYFSFIVYNLIWLFRKNRFPCDISRSHWWKWKSVFQRWLGWDLNLVTMAMAVTTLRIESQTSSRSPRFLWQEELSSCFSLPWFSITTDSFPSFLVSNKFSFQSFFSFGICCLFGSQLIFVIHNICFNCIKKSTTFSDWSSSSFIPLTCANWKVTEVAVMCMVTILSLGFEALTRPPHIGYSERALTHRGDHWRSLT